MFGNVRFFSIVSLIIIIVMVSEGGGLFRRLAEEELTYLVERNNAALAQGYINAVWKKYREVIVPVSGDAEQLQNNAQVMQFAQETVQYFRQMPLVSVNIYNGGGMLLLSPGTSTGRYTDNSPSPDSAFVGRQLQNRGISSNLLRDAVLPSSVHATLLQTIVPLYAEGANAAAVPEGFVEIVYNISDFWNDLKHFQLIGISGYMAVFLIFLCMLFLIFKKAENIITRQHEANIELAAAATAAEAESRDKSQFLANITHELRTPLNAIIGFSDIIKNEVIVNVPERKYHDYINDIHSSGVHLLSLINDILDFSKAEAGKLELEVSEVNASKMVQNCMRLVAPRAESGQVTLVEDLPREQLIVMTDSQKLKQVMLNLLSNAIKFTPVGGSVTVTVWHNIADDSYSFEVRDTGIGIAPKDISRAMSPFGQIDNSLRRKYEGTGLGLPLTKKFVEVMGGKFSIESQVDIGTTISFSLPREVPEREGINIKYVA